MAACGGQRVLGCPVLGRRVFGSSADAGDCCCPCPRPPPTPLMIDYVGSCLLLSSVCLVGWWGLLDPLYSTGLGLGSRQDGGSDSMDGWMDGLVGAL